ncbi:MAG: sigma-70 family RNA polymerase sigma factor [Bacteroides sp.]|nr:sigma-70 family RNA polymerase sigma factor [Eubacterium sp.]MCM1418373.1 sigma-70 family RNA polymerase sigma factor [Roseburia sp.]MCM1462474.1 sigma-70 family RNA polymerase sigma factor [Bacteroides sp.]
MANDERDKEILGLLRSDPEKGLKALISRYGGLVRAVVGHSLLRAADAEACAADAFGEFYLSLDDYDPSKGSLKAWLCAIARHNAVDLARKDRPTLSAEEIALISEEKSPINELEEREFRGAVLAAVKALGEPDREILVRKFYFGESSKRIAAQLRLSVSNVDTRTSRAVAKLRKELEEWRR